MKLGWMYSYTCSVCYRAWAKTFGVKDFDGILAYDFTCDCGEDEHVARVVSDYPLGCVVIADEVER